VFDRLTQAARHAAANAWHAFRPPVLDRTQTRRVLRLPDPASVLERVRRGGFGDDILAQAEAVLAGRYTLLGREIEAASPALDPRLTLELNRHAHWVLLGQAWQLSRDRRYLDEVTRQLDAWLASNPLLRGPHWQDSREVAVRALAWIWLDHLAGADLGEDSRHRLVQGIFHHGLFLFHHVDSLHAAIALHAIAATYPNVPGAAEWLPLALHAVETLLARGVFPDGAYVTLDTAEHVFALDLVLAHYVFAGRPAHLHAGLDRMAVYLHALMGPARRLPALGHGAYGRVFYPYGPVDQFGRATLASCARVLGKPEWLASAEDQMPQAAWWLGESAFAQATGYVRPVSRTFPHSGISALQRGRFWVLFDAGPPLSEHAHADTLGVVVRVGDTDILIDPGGELAGAAFHNVIRVDGANPPAGAPTRIEQAETSADADHVTAICTYAGVTQSRRLELTSGQLLIRDRVELPPGEHTLEQFWHPGLPAVPFTPTRYRIGPYAEITFHTRGTTVAYEQGHEFGWRSTAYGQCEEAGVISVTWRGSGTAEFLTEITLA